MKLFDTNVLIAAMMPHREHYERAATTFETVQRAGEAAIGAHSLAEMYNVLTGRLLVNPKDANTLIKRYTSGLEIIELNASGYANAIARVSNLGISGGAIYDAILAECAVNRQCDTLYTFNIKHYSRFGADISDIAQEP